MNCPECNKKMKVMCYLGEMRLSNGIKRVEVLGRCEDCDFDAIWKNEYDSDGMCVEFDLKQHFFG